MPNASKHLTAALSANNKGIFYLRVLVISNISFYSTTCNESLLNLLPQFIFFYSACLTKILKNT